MPRIQPRRLASMSANGLQKDMVLREMDRLLKETSTSRQCAFWEKWEAVARRELDADQL